MKKIVMVMILMLVTIIPSFAMTDDNGAAKEGRVLLYQKCDESLIGTPDYDESGCPTALGPWPIFPDNNRWGKVSYSLWGDTFKFSFSGRGLEPQTNYTLLYYPDPWPGNNLICLGSGQSTPTRTEMTGRGKGKDKRRGGQRAGNLTIHGDVDIDTSLPAAYDANFTAISPSGAAGAKIRLVLSEDVQCAELADDTGNTLPPHMLNWNPTAYIFEYNLINFEHRDKLTEPY